MKNETVHLCFGPVQEFLAQARRTRDLWAGSYLLSWLAARALCHAHQQGHRIVLPSLDGNALFAAVREKGAPTGSGNRVGSIPHIAELEVSDGYPRDAATQAVDGWMDAWTDVAAEVKEYLTDKKNWKLGGTAEEIWKRQTTSLWSCCWVVGEATGLTHRKTLRSFQMPDEPGEKCTNCGFREALHGDDARHAGVKKFWADAATKVERRDVQPGGRERLCAVCVVKRFFPRVAHGVLGWAVPAGFPSTVSMATLRWRLSVLQAAAADAFLRAAIHDYLKQLPHDGRVQALVGFPAIEKAAAAWPDHQDDAQAFLGYDGDWFLPGELESDEFKDELGEVKQKELRGALAQLLEHAALKALPAPSNIYALLVMDGDHMGRLLSEHAKVSGRKESISQALADFSSQVAGIVESEAACGRLIYAGGDDVLALLPADSVLTAADALRQAYEKAFQNRLPEALQSGTRPSISAGIVFAHVHAPLRGVVRTAHRLLHGRAKKQAGRDAFAVAVWKRPGIVLEFARKWAAPAPGAPASAIANIESLRQALSAGPPAYSTGFLYGLRDLLDITGTLEPETERDILAAEYLKSRERAPNLGQARQRIEDLQRLWRPSADPFSSSEAVAPVLLAGYLTRPRQEA